LRLARLRGQTFLDLPREMWQLANPPLERLQLSAMVHFMFL
jgi:hypothetical protein